MFHDHASQKGALFSSPIEGREFDSTNPHHGELQVGDESKASDAPKSLVFYLAGHPGNFQSIDRIDNLEALRLPLVQKTFLSAISCARIAWVDKTSIFRDAPKAHPWHISFPMIRRPPGFGKTSALSVFKLFYQVFDKILVNPVLSERGLGLTAMRAILDTDFHIRNDAETLVTLSFDFSVLDVSSIDAFITSLHVMSFQCRY